MAQAVAAKTAGAYTVVLGPFIAAALEHAAARVQLDPGPWAMHELPNFSEFLTWIEAEGEDPSAFLSATADAIAAYDAALPENPPPLTNGLVARWMRTREN